MSRAFLLRGAVSVSGNVGKQNINSDYVSVREQSRIEAGDGGFQIVVNGNTDLEGAAITSSQRAVDEGLNRLTTGTLTTSDIENHAHYKGSSVSIGGGYSSSGEGVGTDQQGDAATGAQVPGSTLPSDGNFSATPPIAIAAKGNSSSTTHSGISGAQITITDEAKQQLLTGETVEERLASLNTDVLTGQDGSNALRPIFNEQEIKAGFEIVGALQRETGTFLNNRAKEATAAKEALDKELAKPESERDPAHLAALQQQVNDSATWAPGGTGRQVLTALAAAVGGNVTGASSQMLQGVAVNYLQSLGTQQVKLLADSLDSETARAALQGIVGCAGAAAQGSSCGVGASGAAASVVLNNLFESLSGASAAEMTAEEKQQRIDLINSIVVGVTSALGGEAAVAGAAARIEAENNSLSVAENQARIAEMYTCQEDKGCIDDVSKKYAEISEKNISSAEECVGQEACLAKFYELREWQAEYGQRITDLGDKLHAEGVLSNEELEEIQYLIGVRTLLESSKNKALKNALEEGGGSEELRQLLVDSMAQAVLASAVNSASVGVVQQGKGGASSSSILGQHGVRTASQTVWKGNGKERIDVENPNPGQRAGQIHYQDGQNRKYYYQTSRGVFTLDVEGDNLAPRAIQEKLKNPYFLNGIKKAMKYLGE